MLDEGASIVCKSSATPSIETTSPNAKVDPRNNRSVKRASSDTLLGRQRRSRRFMSTVEIVSVDRFTGTTQRRDWVFAPNRLPGFPENT
jgi:hypothetical protein